jgi:hypothetical protein
MSSVDEVPSEGIFFNELDAFLHWSLKELELGDFVSLWIHNSSPPDNGENEDSPKMISFHSFIQEFAPGNIALKLQHPGFEGLSVEVPLSMKNVAMATVLRWTEPFNSIANAKKLVYSLNRMANLTSLFVTDVQISEEHIAGILEYLAISASAKVNISALSFSSVQIYPSSGEDYVDYFGNQRILELCSILNDYSGLTTLILEDTGMEDESAREVCTLVQNSKTIELLEVAWNDYVEDWMIFAPLLLTDESNLRNISLGRLATPWDEVQMVLEAVILNSSITNLNLPTDLVPTQTTCKLLRENTTLRCLSFGDSARFASAEDFKHLIQSLEHNISIVYFWAGKGLEEMSTLGYDQGFDEHLASSGENTKVSQSLVKLRESLHRNKSYDLLVRKEVLLGYLFLRKKFSTFDVNCFDLIIRFADWKKKVSASAEQASSPTSKSLTNLKAIPLLLQSLTQ